MHKTVPLQNAMRFISCEWKKDDIVFSDKSCKNHFLLFPWRIAPSFTMNIATSTMKLGVLDVSDFPGAGRTGGAGTGKWYGSWLSIPLQLLLGKHLRLPVWINQGADLRWHLRRTHELGMKKALYLFFHKGAHLKWNLEAFFLWFKIGNLKY